MSIESTPAVNEINTKINELKTVARIEGNTIALLMEGNHKGSYAEIIVECVKYHQQFKGTVDAQIVALESTLPVKADTLPKPEAVELAQA